jgi:hypothetical protein
VTVALSLVEGQQPGTSIACIVETSHKRSATNNNDNIKMASTNNTMGVALTADGKIGLLLLQVSFHPICKCYF